MKRATLFIAFMVFSVTLSAQVDISTARNQLNSTRNYLNNVMQDGNAPAEVRQQLNNTLNQVENNLNSLNYGSGTGAVQRQQVQNYNNKISNENQQRMTQYNNPQYYTDRSITNTGTQGISADDRYRQPNNYYSGDMRTQPIHSENLDSKSLQMLREANLDYFSNNNSNDNTDLTIDPNATVPLFDAPSLNDKDDDVVYEGGENDEYNENGTYYIENNNQNITSDFKDVDFESRIANMPEESLKQWEQTYKEYSDLSEIAAYSYRDGNSLPDGWEDMAQKDLNIQRIIADIELHGGYSSGLKFSVLKKSDEDKYVIAFAGTDFPKDLTDLSQDIDFIKQDGRADIQGTFSSDEAQINLAKQAIQKLCKEGNIPLEKMEFTGHSLGGRLAAEMSVQYARPATTFNAAGVCEETQKQYEMLMAHSNNHYTGIRNVVTEHDFLTNLQSMGSGAKNEYAAALKEPINIIHETTSGTLSSSMGKAAVGMLGIVAPPVGKTVKTTGEAISVLNQVNKYYNRDYRALGGTVVLNDGKSGISGSAHSINLVSDLLKQRQKAISNRLNITE